MNRRVISAAVAGVVGTIAPFAAAAPYASQIIDNGTSVDFTLNEDADSVIVYKNNVPTDLGALSRGTYNIVKAAPDTYSIVASKASVDGYLTPLTTNVATPLQLSDDSQNFEFEAPRGIVVNNNPANGALFGRIYVAQQRNATTGSGRTTNEGIYIISPDWQDPFAMRNALGAGFDEGRTGGIDFATGGTSSPYNLKVDAVGNLFITDWSDAHGSIYVTNPDVDLNSFEPNLFAGQGAAAPTAPTVSLNHGSISALHVEGTYGADLTVYTVDEDLTPVAPTADQMNSLWQYNVGSVVSTEDLPDNPGKGKGYTGTPTQLANVLIDTAAGGGVFVDLARGGDGKFYLAQERFDGNESGLFVVDSDGTTVLYSSRADTIARGLDADPGLTGTQDILRRSRYVDISADGEWLILGRTSSGGDNMMVPLLDGIPDLPNRVTLDMFAGGTSNDVTFDAAGNVYGGNQTDELMRIFSPGGVSETTFNSDGSFSRRLGPHWNFNAGGNISDGTKWLQGVTPNGISAMATFGEVLDANSVVSVNSDVTIGTLNFDSNEKYTLSAGGGTISLDSFGEPRVTVKNGSHQIDAPVRMFETTQFTILDAADTLTVSDLEVDPAFVSPVSVIKAGAGTLEANGIRAVGLDVKKGTAKMLASGNTNDNVSRVSSLSIAAGATLDLTDNDLIVDGGSYSVIEAAVIQGYDNGTWSGEGITSSTAAANASLFSLGVADNDDLNNTEFSGQTGLDGDEILVKSTYVGDANLTGGVNLDDFNQFLFGFNPVNAAPQIWLNGDFNYTGAVNLDDFNLFLFGLANQGGTLVSPELFAALSEFTSANGVDVDLSAIPEPGSLSLLGLGAASLLARRRKA